MTSSSDKNQEIKNLDQFTEVLKDKMSDSPTEVKKKSISSDEKSRHKTNFYPFNNRKSDDDTSSEISDQFRNNLYSTLFFLVFLSAWILILREVLPNKLSAYLSIFTALATPIVGVGSFVKLGKIFDPLASSKFSDKVTYWLIMFLILFLWVQLIFSLDGNFPAWL